MKLGKKIWLIIAHAEFAEHGPSMLKVDTIAKLVGKARSSFYHQFGDMEGFEEALIDYDLEMTRRFQEESNEIDVYFPDYANLIIKYKDMIFFNRHLFLLSDKKKKYEEAWNRVAELVDDKTEVLWMKLVNMEDLPSDQKEQFYLTIRTAAFMRLNYHDFTYENLYKVVTGVNESFGFLLKP